MRLACLFLVCALTGCERHASLPAPGQTVGSAQAASGTTRKVAEPHGGFGDAWNMTGGTTISGVDKPAPTKADPREEMRKQIERFREGRARARQAAAGKLPQAGLVATPALRPGDKVGQRAGDLVLQGQGAPAPSAVLAGPGIGIQSPASADPMMVAQLARFRAAQMSRSGPPAIPQHVGGMPGIPASTRPGTKPDPRPGGMASNQTTRH